MLACLATRKEERRKIISRESSKTRTKRIVRDFVFKHLMTVYAKVLLHTIRPWLLPWIVEGVEKNETGRVVGKS